MIATRGNLGYAGAAARVSATSRSRRVATLCAGARGPRLVQANPSEQRGKVAPWQVRAHPSQRQVSQHWQC